MGRIFLAAGHSIYDPGAVVQHNGETITEASEMIATRDLIQEKLQSLNPAVEYHLVPDNLDVHGRIAWINERANPSDVALEIHGNAATSDARGAETFYIANNEERRQDARLILDHLVSAVDGLQKRSADPDSRLYSGGLAFCRQVMIPSVLVELCFLDNKQDWKLLKTQRDQFAKGIAEGLLEWTDNHNGGEKDYPRVNIRIKDDLHAKTGILVDRNTFIPIELVNKLGLDVNQVKSTLPSSSMIESDQVVHVKALDLEQFKIRVRSSSVSSDPTVVLIPDFDVNPDIMAAGEASAEQMRDVLEQKNERALKDFPNIIESYIKYAAQEGVNHDVAFCQMCLETNYLRFGGSVKPEQNNFCGLGATGPNEPGESFKDVATGVKAQIQHLKAYGSTESINSPPIVDPRFDYVNRGVAFTVHCLTGRWAMDPDYGKKIMSILRRLRGVS